jgi:MoaA/NifB/PqqE/SkfB family radical SAM enzyme
MGNKATDVSGTAPGGQRIRLVDSLPLKTPYLIEIFPSYLCNFKCKYCIHSIPLKERGYISDKIHMDFVMYKRCIDDISKFPEKLKVLRFAGMGEPLLHPDIVGMVAYAKYKNIADKIEILTNGSLLTHKLSDALIKAGLTRLYVSLQGLSSERYLEVSGIKLDFDKFVDNIRYYYESKGDLKIHIKIIDYTLKDDKEKAQFYQIFSGICDTIGIELASPIYPYVDYNKVLEKNNDTKTQFGLCLNNIKTCPQPFFRLHIIPDFNVIPCYSMEYPEIIGNCANDSIVDIWKGGNLKKFRLGMLKEGVCFNKICNKCKIIKCRIFQEDILDNDVERLKGLY